MLLSGIGPAAQSKALGITPIVDSPDVGQNMQDHPLLSTNYEVSSTETLDNLVTNTTLQAEALALWQSNRTGDFTLGVCNQWVWGRLPDNDPIFNEVVDPSAGPTSPHYQLIFSVSLIILHLNCILRVARIIDEAGCAISRISPSPLVALLLRLVTSSPSSATSTPVAPVSQACKLFVIDG